MIKNLARGYGLQITLILHRQKINFGIFYFSIFYFDLLSFKKFILIFYVFEKKIILINSFILFENNISVSLTYKFKIIILK